MTRTVTFFNHGAGEDGLKRKTEATRGGTTVTPDSLGEGFSVGRRDLLVVEFTCENCNRIKDFELNILQHKGFTRVTWNAKTEIAGDDDSN